MNTIRKNYIDVLKAFAIIAVVLYHSGFMTFGYLGVDLFLVINGYLITKSLRNKILITNDFTGIEGGVRMKFKYQGGVNILTLSLAESSGYCRYC